MVYQFTTRPIATPPTAAVTGAAISHDGKFIITAGANANARRLMMWNPTTETYDNLTYPASTINAQVFFSPDGTRILGTDSTGAYFIYSLNQTTGAVTLVASGNTGSANRHWVLLSNTVMVSCPTGATRVANVYEVSGAALVLRNGFSIPGTPGNLGAAPIPGPLANSFYRIETDGRTQLMTVNLTTFAVTVVADTLTGGPTNTTSVNHGRTSSDGKTIVMGAAGTTPTTPFIKLLHFNTTTSTFTWIPTGGTAAGNFPRTGNTPGTRSVGIFASRDNAIIVYRDNTAIAPLVAVQMNEDATDFQNLNPALIPNLGSGYGSLALGGYTTHQTPDATMNVLITTAAPFLIVVQEVPPDALLSARGIMGSASMQMMPSIDGNLSAAGIMGSAALAGDVSTNASASAVGFIASAALVAGQDTSGPDTILIYVNKAPLALDTANIEYDVEFVSRHLWLNVVGLMGQATVRASLGRYGNLSAVGLMGNATLEANYDTAQIEIDAVGLMGIADISGEAQIGVRIQVQGIMGDAIMAGDVQTAAFLAPVGLMGDASAQLNVAITGELDALGIMGNATVYILTEEGGLIEATGLMGDAALRMDYWLGSFDALGIMGDAALQTNELNRVMRIFADGIMGEASIELEEAPPRIAELGVLGLMGSADMILDIAGFAGLIVEGIMGTAEIELEIQEFLSVNAIGIMGLADLVTEGSGELARFEPIGVMGTAEFLNLPGMRGDIRARGIMGVANIEGEVQWYGDIRADGIMGYASIETRDIKKRKSFFVTKPF